MGMMEEGNLGMMEEGNDGRWESGNDGRRESGKKKAGTECLGFFLHFFADLFGRFD